MKKIFLSAAVVAATLSMTACGGTGFGKGDIDTLSYAVGADLGLNLNFGMRDMELDEAVVLANI